MLKRILLVCLLALPAGVFAQHMPAFPPSNSQPINRYDLLDKTWFFVGMKCPDKIGAEAQYVHYFSSLKLTASNVNNINYGTYVKTYQDMRDNPLERGTYSLTNDEVGNVVLTLKKSKTGATARYMVPMVETSHLTLIRLDEGEKCNITYAIAP
jgi:glutaredoxin-related protein